MGLFFLCLFFASSIHATVELDLNKGNGNSTLWSDLSAGLYDFASLEIPVKWRDDGMSAPEKAIQHQGEEETLSIRSSTLKDFSAELREAVLQRLHNGTRTYRAVVDARHNDLLKQRLIVDFLKIDIASLGEHIEAPSLLSDFGKRWAYQSSGDDGPNCWHSSIASISKGWVKARYMSPEEFTCHLENSFEEIATPSQWGDLIRIALKNEEVHGFTFLGVDRKNREKKIVFSKNGYRQSAYQIEDYDAVSDGYGGSSETLKFYRRVREVLDPTEDSSAPCARLLSNNVSRRRTLREYNPALYLQVRRGLLALPLKK